MLITSAKRITSVVWRAAKCHCQAAEFMLHIYLNKFKYIYEYQESIFVSCLDTAAGGLYVTIMSQVVV